MLIFLLNINYGHNAELMEKCKQLRDYSTFIYYIRRSQASGMNTLQAVNKAIDDCIRGDVLRDFLVKHRGEVRDMVLFSFDREIYERDLRAEGREEGRIEGRKISIIQKVCKKLLKNKTPEVIAEELEETLPVIQKICETAEQYKPDYDCNKIYEQLEKESF